MAITDQLTGLYNRRYMSRHLATLMKNATPGQADLVSDHGHRLLQGGQRYPRP